MRNIYDINTKNNNRPFIENMKKEFDKLFHSVSDLDLCVISDFPSVTDSLKTIDYMIFIDIPQRKGNYYRCCDEEGKWIYLYNLVIAIEKLEDTCVTKVENDHLYNNDEGAFDYKGYLEKMESEFNEFAKNAIKEKYFNCSYVKWIKSSSKPLQNESIICNKGLNVKELIGWVCKKQCHEHTFQGTQETRKMVRCWSKDIDLKNIVEKLLDTANEQTQIGILTKKKIDQITKKVKLVESIKQSQDKLCIITGKAGSGKTLALLRIMQATVCERHHVRFLTFNHSLVYDIKYCLRNLAPNDSMLASIETLHHFFYSLYKKLRISNLFTDQRVKELLEVCQEKVDKAEDLIKEYGELPWSIKDFLGKFATDINEVDEKEIRRYVEYRIRNRSKSAEDVKKRYLNKIKKMLEHEQSSMYFLQDYYKVLETIYMILTQTKEFYEKYNVKNRYEWLLKFNKTDKIDKNEMLSYEVFSDLFKRNINNVANWSNMIIVDEAQDCHLYEKLILYHLKEAQSLIISSGGKDQLIRTSKETNWKVMFGNSIAFEEFKLGNRSFRQKESIIKFINSFLAFYNLSTPIQSGIQEAKGTGNVILDIRPDGELSNLSDTITN